MKPMCPRCGNELVFQQVLRACKTTKINKDGTLSRRTKNIINGEDTDICYLNCDCGFIYNLTYKDTHEEEIKEFDIWYEKITEQN
jgi:hypothetical protein